ncbi:hypothetical protein LOC68_07510 [Blastopirellula sp. JC732]|uniref:Uncharacterized protein n=1 Tax=Blastopirellula sediminis TaxID=2894196 RepID=A0A9X1MLS0_9BACT|nr:hypothetical protein [Blastopirellula sediminis]MCC9608986.1 hypothetical protein [Blastopirellula sediminis]MCC9628237.1 hypothetical protein [Blastopirellula sediminis]
MNIDDAILLLQKHNNYLADEPDNFIGNLRPYSGIRKAYFSEIVKAIYFAAPLLNQPHVDRDTIHLIWDMTRGARLLTQPPHEPHFHGRHFISAEDKQTLDRWIYMLEELTLDLLRGLEPWEPIGWQIPWEMTQYDSIVDPAWLTEPLMKSLESFLDNQADGVLLDDDQIMLCNALGMIGADAASAISLLQQVAEASRYEPARTAAQNAIATINRSAAERSE